MKSRLNFIILISLIFSLCAGCLPLVFVAGATIGGAVVYDKRDTSTIFNDATIGKQIKNKINSDDLFRIYKTRIKIAVFNHVVLLTGEVPTNELRQRAYNIAMSVSKVKRVYNQIAVMPIISFREQSDDALITSKVKSMMLVTRDLHSTQIKVVTENKVVYLMGIVTRKQAGLAANTTRHVTGVSKVVEVFEYEE